MHSSLRKRTIYLFKKNPFCESSKMSINFRSKKSYIIRAWRKAAVLFILTVLSHSKNNDDGTFFGICKAMALSKSNAVQILGAGSSFAAPVYSPWMSSFEALRQPFVDVDMSYAAVGSGEGKRRMRNNSFNLQYAGSDTFSQQELQTNRDFFTFPTMAGASCIVFNLPDASSNTDSQVARLNLSREAVVGIFNGTITYWNDPIITVENPEIKSLLPSEKIRVVVRKDDSGTTSMFTSALSRFSSAWATSYGAFTRSARWNRSAITYYGVQNRGLAGIILSFPYSIGYVSVGDVVDMGLNYAMLKNRAGRYVDARNVNALQSSMDDFVERLDENLIDDITDGAGSDSYPIIGLTYMIVSKTQKTKCDAAEEFIRYADWFLTDDNAHRICVDHNMAPLSPRFSLLVINKIIRKFECAGRNMWSAVEARRAAEYRSLETWRLPVFILTPIICTAIIALIGYIIYMQLRQSRAIRQNLFIIPARDVKLIKRTLSNITSSAPSVMSNNSAMFTINKTIMSSDTTDVDDSKRRPAVLRNGIEVELTECVVIGGENSSHNNDITKLAFKTRRLLLSLRDRVVHKNVQRFCGLTTLDDTLQQHQHFLVREACSKGNMQALIHGGKYEIDAVIQFSLATDIACGMEYLHREQLIHGQLRTWTCLIDARWQVNIGDWEWQRFREQNGCELRQPSEATSKTVLSYDGRWIAPEVLKIMLSSDHQRRQADLNSSKTFAYPIKQRKKQKFNSLVFSKAVDVYSFGIVMYEIFERDEPYSTTSLSETFVADVGFIDEKSDDALLWQIVNKSVRPKWNTDLITNANIRALVESLWREAPDQRPTFQFVVRKLRNINPSGTKSMIDLMMKALEEYTASLEDRVLERTRALQQVTHNMEELLHRMVPPSIADKLTRGETVLPEGYDSVSIFFSDVIGFTAICAASTPLEIVQMLNNLYTTFDETIDAHDVFKVETIGDAYMLISGLPNRNGITHAGHISNVALALLAVVMNMTITHMPDVPLQIRSGIHSGAVMAGVVGAKMPRYCLFGDSVNTAARMESSSLPMRIQISEATKLLLDKLDVKFDLIYRGEQDVKGKGLMTTYWLAAKAEERRLHLPVFDWSKSEQEEKDRLTLSGQYK